MLRMLPVLSTHANRAKKESSGILLHLMHVKSIFHQQLFTETATDCSSALLITVWWMFLLKISHPLLIAAGCSVCQLWKYSILQLGHTAYCNQSQMQTFIPMIPWLWSLLVYCSVHFGCEIPSEQKCRRLGIKSLTSAKLKSSSQRISFSFS